MVPTPTLREFSVYNRTWGLAYKNDKMTLSEREYINKKNLNAIRFEDV